MAEKKDFPIDRATGLPRLQEPCIWRISKEDGGPYGYPYTVIEIVAPNQDYVKKRFLRKSIVAQKDIVIDSSTIRTRLLVEAEDPTRIVLECAQELVHEMKNREEIAALYGDYPPNKLY